MKSDLFKLRVIAAVTLISSIIAAILVNKKAVGYYRGDDAIWSISPANLQFAVVLGIIVGIISIFVGRYCYKVSKANRILKASLSSGLTLALAFILLWKVLAFAAGV
jgi:hypothetical protein